MSSAASAAPLSSHSSNTTTTPKSSLASRRTTPKQKYLISYNAISALLWARILYQTVLHAAPTPRPHELYESTGIFTRYVQTVALLEIVHAGTGLVRSGMATTALQVASRVTLIWWIVEWFGEPRWETAYVSMLGAWSLTEVVRYGYFVCALLGDVPGVLVWLRYNLFFILYPVGISSEAWLVYSSIPEARKQNPYLAYALYAILGIYVPGAYVLYSHMMAQRRRVLRGKQRARS